MFCTRKRAATDASLLGLKGGTCGFIAAARGCCLSHKSSKGYNCWTARSTRDVPDHSTAPLTTPSVSTLRFSTIPNGHLTLFLSSACKMTTSPTAGAFPWLVFWVRSLSRRPLRYSLDQRRHTASLHMSRCFDRLRLQAASIRCGCNSGRTLLTDYFSWTTWSLVSEQVTADRLPDNSTVGYKGWSRLATPLVTPCSSKSHY